MLWGVNWPIMKMGLAYLSPLWFAATRMGLGALCLFALLAMQGRLLWPGRRELGILIAVGVFQIGLPTGLIHTGLLSVEAGRSAILVFTIPLWVAPMAVLVLGERMDAIKLVGLVLGLSGLAMLFNPLTFPFGDRGALVGNALMLGASLSFAVALVIIRRHPWTVPTIRLMPWQMLLGTLILVVAAAAIEGVPRPRWSPALYAIMAYNGPIASAFCFWAFVTVSRSLPAMSTALGSLGVPVVGIVSAAMILDEGFGVAKIVGLVLISLGVVAVSALDLGRVRTS
ncbi:MAG: DMT family transporter [Rhodospirillales bacterium]|nr:DMT family transporter [Rhodospirillales bacterium]